MKVLHLSAYDLLGGAAKAAFRLHSALIDAGVDSTMMVRRRDSARRDIMEPAGSVMKLWSKVQRRFDRLPLIFKDARADEFSPGFLPDGIAPQLRDLNPDVVHLHWVAHGFVRPDLLPRIKVPVVWTMHDMWPFTGGCHYAGSCREFLRSCGSCPMLGSDNPDDLSHLGWNRRQKAFQRKAVTFVSPSRWLASEARSSALLRDADIRVIPNGIDENRFSPGNRIEARKRWNLPADRVLLLVGSAQLHNNPRKGFDDVLQALKILESQGVSDRIELVLFGGVKGPDSECMGFRAHQLGTLSGEEEMALVYAACDFFVAPSRQDNLPNTVIEAMASGIPVVAYGAGGITEIVDDRVNGVVVSAGQIDQLAQGILVMGTNDILRTEYGKRARQKAVAVFGRKDSAEAYRRLYLELLTRR